MSNITLLELNVPDSNIQIGPKSLRGSTANTTEEVTESDTDTSSESGRPLGTLLVFVGIIAVLAVITTKVLSVADADEIVGFDDEN